MNLHLLLPEILVVAAVLAIAGWATLPFLPLQTSVDALSAGLPAVDDAAKVEQTLGSGGELAVVLRTADGAAGGKADVLTPEAWTWMTAAQQQIDDRAVDRATPRRRLR